jgi:hypothetical protein
MLFNHAHTPYSWAQRSTALSPCRELATLFSSRCWWTLLVSPRTIHARAWRLAVHRVVFRRCRCDTSGITAAEGLGPVRERRGDSQGRAVRRVRERRGKNSFARKHYALQACKLHKSRFKVGFDGRTSVSTNENRHVARDVSNRKRRKS